MAYVIEFTNEELSLVRTALSHYKFSIINKTMAHMVKADVVSNQEFEEFNRKEIDRTVVLLEKLNLFTFSPPVQIVLNVCSKMGDA